MSPCSYFATVTPSTRAGLPLSSSKRPNQSVLVDVMQQGREPSLGSLLGRRVHPFEVRRQGNPALCPDPGLLAREGRMSVSLCETMPLRRGRSPHRVWKAILDSGRGHLKPRFGIGEADSAGDGAVVKGRTSFVIAHRLSTIRNFILEFDAVSS